MSFCGSTQQRNWVFESPNVLEQQRAAANEHYRARVAEAHEGQSCLTAEEELAVVRHFASHVPKLCSAFKPPLPDRVYQTATQFLLRFYLRRSVMEYHPESVMHTCVYLGCKVEECRVKLADFEKLTANVRSMKELELELLQALAFNLVVFGPLRPLKGFGFDFENKIGKPLPEECLKKAREVVEEWSVSDVLLLFPPSVIGLAALRSASKGICDADVLRYVQELGVDNEQLDKVVATATSVNLLQSHAMTDLLAKLTHCPRVVHEKAENGAATGDKRKRDESDTEWVTGIKQRKPGP